jgi:hypothetical protein
MKKRFAAIFLFTSFFFFISRPGNGQTIHADILIIGGGASGTTAGIQAARLGASTLIIEETQWLGGMLTSAGVSAIDGNHRLPAGIWGEFRNNLYAYYGSPSAIETGWVSNTLFEPFVGNKILKQMVAAEPLLKTWFKSSFQSVSRSNGLWKVNVLKEGKVKTIESKILIDATELGDVLASVGVKFSIGMDSRNETGEMYAPETANDIIQDLTYVVTLKDYGKGADKTIKKPKGYDPAEFSCCCDVSDPASFGDATNNCFKMLQYGRLPNNKYMINWPKCGNDIYLNIIEQTPQQRLTVLQEAKLHTLRFVYYLQTALGYKNLGIADDEYPTRDRLPMIPYYRESRRMKGLVTLTLPYVAKPYGQQLPLYRTGIAVGDYPIDHHHLKNPSAPSIDFVKIKVPSYNVPLGCLIPSGTDGLIVAEKSISVSNIVNGATRLQPVVLQLGQAAGVLAAIAVKEGKQPSQVSVRSVQEALLKANGYIMPFIDVSAGDPDFAAIQKIGATGILKGFGVSYRWANQTWFYPDLPISQSELVSGLAPYYSQLLVYRGASGELMNAASLVSLFHEIGVKISLDDIAGVLMERKVDNLLINGKKLLSRRAVALIIDKYLKSFERPINISGNLTKDESRL